MPAGGGVTGGGDWHTDPSFAMAQLWFPAQSVRDGVG